MSFNCQMFIFILLLNILINLSTAQFRSSGVQRKSSQSCDILNSNGKEYLLDSSSETQRCFLIGSRGPCGEMMTFYKNPLKKDLRGFCDCEQGHIDHNDSPIRKRIYHPKDQRCYTAFSQGPCRVGEWLVLNDRENAGACVRNQCLQHGKSRDTNDQFWFYDPQRRRCYKTYTQGYCNFGMQLELVDDSQYPTCRSPTWSGSLANDINSILSCQTGSRFSYLTNSCRFTFRRKGLFSLG